MKSTRQQILDTLEKNQPATAAQLSRELQITQADVRYHLAALRRSGAIILVEAGRPEGRGRPARRYRLAEQTRGETWLPLLEALLTEALELATPEAQKEFLQRIAARLAGQGKPQGSLASRLVQAMKRLNELHYQARWEARPGGPQITLSHCPYTASLPDHMDLCQLDAALLEILLGVPITQIARREQEAGGGKYCRFSIRKRP